MIAPLAITLALALWQPYTPIDPATGQHTPVCPNGVHITYEPSSLGAPSLSLQAWVDYGMVPNPACAMHVRRNVADEPIPYQCVIVAHELGHAAMGLPDSTDGGIMDGPTSIPGGCYPPSQPVVKHYRRLSQVKMAPARRQPPGAWHRRSIFDAGQHYRPPGGSSSAGRPSGR